MYTDIAKLILSNHGSLSKGLIWLEKLKSPFEWIEKETVDLILCWLPI